MASAAALLLTLNILFFTVVSSTCPPPPPPKPKCPTTPVTPTPTPVTPTPTPATPTPVTPTPTPATPTPSHHHHHKRTCPKDTLKLGACANVLNDLIHLVIGAPSKTPCCSLLGGLADLDAAVCLCTAIKANVLGINLNVPVSLSLILNYCGKKSPKGFKCA